MTTQASELLRLLHTGAPWAYLWTDQSDRPDGHGTSLWYAPSEGVPSPPAHWRNVYFSVHGCHSRGTEQQRSGLDGERLAVGNCLYADFDAKHVDGGLAAILARLERLPREGLAYPTAVVHSGGGLHCYWVLEMPVNLLRRKSRAGMARAQRLWVDQAVRADPSAKDLGRVLRLPGTYNHKYDPPRPVELIEFNAYRVYRAGDIRAMLDPYIRLDEAQAQLRAEQAAAAAERQPVAWQRLLQWAHQDAQGGTRHRVGLRLAFRLKEAGCPENLAETLVDGYLNAHVTDRPTHGEAKGLVRYAYR